MKTYTVTKGTKLIEYVTYTVEADSKEEALEIVQNEDVDDNGDHWTTDTGEETYSVEE